jgi:hypothetical protein
MLALWRLHAGLTHGPTGGDSQEEWRERNTVALAEVTSVKLVEIRD